MRLGERDRYLPGLRSGSVFGRRASKFAATAALRRPSAGLAVADCVRLAKTAIFSFSTFPLAVFTLIGYRA